MLSYLNIATTTTKTFKCSLFIIKHITQPLAHWIFHTFDFVVPVSVVCVRFCVLLVGFYVCFASLSR